MAIEISRPVIYPSEINRILRKPGGPVGVKIRRMCLDIAAEAKQIAVAELGKHPHDDPRAGKFSRAFKVEVKTGPGNLGYEFNVYNTAPYSAILEEGSKAHVIAARRAKTLVFRSRQNGGRLVRKRVVFHPGTKGYHILWRATEKVVKAQA